MGRLNAPRILLVEDNPADVRLAEEAFRESPRQCHLEVARDGAEALSRLRRHLASDTRLPELILLDLNLPRLDGRGVLAEVKGDPRLRRIPVVILTTSDADQDVEAAYDLHANCYVVKPLGLEAYVSLIRALESFWFTVVRRPH